MEIQNSTGDDENPVKILKFTKDDISIPISNFVNLSVELNLIPDTSEIG